MRPVNLIPPEDRRGDHAPLRAGVASYAIVARARRSRWSASSWWCSTGNDISDSEAELAALEARQAQADLARRRAGALRRVRHRSSRPAAETVSSLAQSRFDWERVLNELALVIPRRVTLENLTGTVGAGVAVGGEPAARRRHRRRSIAGPSLQIGGCAKGQKGVARLLAALRDIDGVTRVGMQSSELGEEASPGARRGADERLRRRGPPSDCQTAARGRASSRSTVAFDAVPVRRGDRGTARGRPRRRPRADRRRRRRRDAEAEQQGGGGLGRRAGLRGRAASPTRWGWATDEVAPTARS